MSAVELPHGAQLTQSVLVEPTDGHGSTERRGGAGELALCTLGVDVRARNIAIAKHHRNAPW